MKDTSIEQHIIDLGNGIILQRLNKDFLWYALKDNKIIDYNQYREDLIEKYKSVGEPKLSPQYMREF